MCDRFTKDIQYLEQVKKAAFMLKHSDIPNEERDASAAAVLASRKHCCVQNVQQKKNFYYD